MQILLHSLVILLSLTMVRTRPQDLTEREFRQDGRSLSGEGAGEGVIISGGYTKTRRQGRAGYTEVLHHMGPDTVVRSYETDLETEKILDSIEHVNNALAHLDEGIADKDAEEVSEARGEESKNVFQVLWEQILSG